MMPIGSIINAIGSIGGQLLRGGQQRRNVRDQKKANIELSQFAHDRNVELWREQMEYNRPKNQMERFAEAGLNPHLIYGQGTPGQAETAPQMAPPQAGDYSQRGPMVEPMQTLNEYLQVADKKQQLDHMEWKIKAEEANIDMVKLKSDGIFQENTIRTLEATVARAITDREDLNQLAHLTFEGMKADQWLKQAVSEFKQWEARYASEYNLNPRDSAMWKFAMDLLESFGFSPKRIRELIRQ